MSAKKLKANATKKPAQRSKPLNIEGTFNDLIRQSLAAPKPKGGWPKARDK